RSRAGDVGRVEVGGEDLRARIGRRHQVRGKTLAATEVAVAKRLAAPARCRDVAGEGREAQDRRRLHAAEIVDISRISDVSGAPVGHALPRRTSPPSRERSAGLTQRPQGAQADRKAPCANRPERRDDDAHANQLCASGGRCRTSRSACGAEPWPLTHSPTNRLPGQRKSCAMGVRLVPRTRSSHEFSFSADTVANFGFQSGTRIMDLLVSFSIPKFAPSPRRTFANFGIGTRAPAAARSRGKPAPLVGVRLVAPANLPPFRRIGDASDAMASGQQQRTAATRAPARLYLVTPALADAPAASALLGPALAA